MADVSRNFLIRPILQIWSFFCIEVKILLQMKAQTNDCLDSILQALEILRSHNFSKFSDFSSDGGAPLGG